MASTTAEIIWIESLICELGIKLQKRPIIWCDIMSTTSLSANPILYSRTKHIEIDLYFVRERVIGGKFEVSHVPAPFQRADAQIKALTRGSFERFKKELKIEAAHERGNKEETLV